METLADRPGGTAVKDGEVSEKSPAVAAIPVLVFSGRAEPAPLGSGLEEAGVESSKYRACTCTLEMS